MTTGQQEAFAENAGTSISYLRKAISIDQRIGEGLCIRIERASDGAVKVEDLRPDLAEAWAYIRGTGPAKPQSMESAA